MKKIGNVKLYGEYDGSNENIHDAYYEIWNLYKTGRVKENNQMVKEKPSCVYLTEFASCRGNIVKCFDIQKEDKILEIGSGCGAVTEQLLKCSDYVRCVEHSAIKSEINAYRNQKENLEIYVDKKGNLVSEVKQEDYDFIFMWGDICIDKMDESASIMQLRKMLKPKGKLILAVDNKYGLRYWAGYKERYTDEYFEHIVEKREHTKKTYAKSELNQILKVAGVSEIIWYYPYPDYEFMFSLYTDEYLPKRGELTTKMHPFEKEQMVLFDEGQVFDNLVQDGLFSQFSNSFLIVIEGE